MGRPRTPTNILEMRGAFKANPQRKRRAEPKPKGAFPSRPPSHLSAAEKATWKEVVRRVPAGVLGDADVFQVESLARLLTRFRMTDEPPMTMYQTLGTLLGKLGLNPASRAALTVEKPKTNKYADE